jgi:hypothetical protein
MQNLKTVASKTLFIGVVSLLILISCQPSADVEKRKSGSLINTSHLDALYKELIIGGDSMGIVHIYSEYPDYKMVDDADEGIACVDDASRAAIFYLREYKRTGDGEYLHKGRRLLKFLLYMQAPNGYYYNFIWKDGSRNTEGITSKPEPNFWTWRTLWAFGEALDVLDANEKLVDGIRMQRNRLVNNILSEPAFRSNATDTTMGITFATWLPKISGTDQASIGLIGLSAMLRQEKMDSTQREQIISFMEHFADGITLMQIEQPDSLHDGAFLSWENLWHAYANIQSYALLTAGEFLDDEHMIAHALYEIDNFYPAFVKAEGLEHFFVRQDSNKISRYDTKVFPQIAYGRRPMVWAALKAYQLTGEEKYNQLVKDLMGWFHGENPARIKMYDDSTGRGYDGITDRNNFNRNAGAESTIESLLALQAVEIMNKANQTDTIN